MSSQQLDAFEAGHAVALQASSHSPRHLPSLTTLDMVKLFLNRRRNRNLTSTELIARLLEVVEECFTTHEYLSLFDDMNLPSHHVDTHFQFIQAFLSQPYLGANYVSEIEVSRLYQEVVLEGVTDPAKRALVFASMAIGNINCSKSSHSSPTTSNETGGNPHYQEALLAVEKMFVARPSILVFKALLTTLVATLQYRVEQTSCVLGLCVSCAQALRLNSMAAIRQLCQTDREINQLRQAFWLLYCIEKAFRMRSGQFSSISDAFIDHSPLTDCDKTGTTSTSRDFHAHCRLSQLCSRMSEDLHMAGDARDPNSITKVSDRAEKWIVVLQRFNSEVLETEGWEDHIFAWTPNSTHPDTSKLSCPDSSYPSKLFLFEMALFAYGRLFQKAGTDISLDKSEHIIAQFASEVLNVIVNMDPSTTSMNRHFVQVAVGSFCITAAFAHLRPDQATIFKQLVSTLGLFARVSTTSSVVSLGKLSSVVDSVQRLMTPDTQRSSQGV
ncbi:Fumonisin cluster-specific transcription factor FUM21 [Colletotrichum tropicale]|nr:Fumonisin cluster-specific transcription factor FUM21 [Colletotrichum tropicale]